MVFTAMDDTTIQVRHYEVPKISEGDKVDFKEIGPRFDFKMRRAQIASNDLFKLACKKAKVANVEKKKANKNVYTNEIGEKKGKVFI